VGGNYHTVSIGIEGEGLEHRAVIDLLLALRARARAT